MRVCTQTRGRVGGGYRPSTARLPPPGVDRRSPMNELFAPAKPATLAEPSPKSPTAFFGRLVGRSQVMRDVIDRLRTISAHDATLLLEGESGTGKEIAAEAVHAASARRHKPFVVVDCGAIARPLLEAELFGHERGAYTG